MPKKNKFQNPADIVSALLLYIGENPSRPGLVETPQRTIKAYREFLGGYSEDVKKLFKTFPSDGYKGLLTVTDIDFYSMCEHHMLPFFGKAHIGYVPNGRILGLSKFARLIDIHARRLQTQENLTNQIAQTLEKNLHPRGLIVMLEARHMCVSMRGIKKNNFITKTTVKKGVLDKNDKYLDQFYRDILLDNKVEKI